MSRQLRPKWVCIIIKLKNTVLTMANWRRVRLYLPLIAPLNRVACMYVSMCVWRVFPQNMSCSEYMHFSTEKLPRWSKLYHTKETEVVIVFYVCLNAKWSWISVTVKQFWNCRRTFITQSYAISLRCEVLKLLRSLLDVFTRIFTIL